MKDKPFSFKITNNGELTLDPYDNHITRRLSDMRGQYADSDAFNALLKIDNPLLYEVYEVRRPEMDGELIQGLSIVHPGKVGNEYYMTKGHFHVVLDTAEIYYCLNGRGMMVMETPEGEWAVEELLPQQVLYVPPRWAHRSVNTHPNEKLVTFFVYPAQAGHDYGTIEKFGFRKLVIEENRTVRVIDNPRRPMEG